MNQNVKLKPSLQAARYLFASKNLYRDKLRQLKPRAYELLMPYSGFSTYHLTTILYS